MENKNQLKKLMRMDKNKLLSAHDIASAKKCVQIVCYKGKKDEDYVKTRITKISK